MTHARTRWLAIAAAAILLTPVATAMVPATAAPGGGGTPRADGQGGLPDKDERYSSPRKPTASQRKAVAALGDDVEVGWSSTGSIHSLRAREGALTGRSGARPESIARQFLRENRVAFGLSAAEVAALRLTMDDRQSGAAFLRFQQYADTREVVGGNVLVTLDRDGRVLLAGGNLLPGAASAPGAKISAESAVAVAGNNVSPKSRPLPGKRLGTKNGKERFENTLAVPDYDGSPVEADLVVVGTDDGPRTAWRVLADHASDASYTVLVDAATGEVLSRTNGVTSDGPQGTVFPGEDPEAGGRGVVAFPAGWIDAGGDTTAGNNANTYQDAEGDNAADADGSDQPQAADQHFDYAWNDPWGASVAGAEADLPLTGADRDAVVTQLHYYTNWFHDYAYVLGFTETARNFQNDNFGNGGSGSDAVEAESDANFTGQQCSGPSKCLNNANFTTNGADGNRPRMQMYVGDTNPGGAARRTQRANNRDTVIHEYTHGISGRIISNTNLQGGIQSSSLGEGWSDAFATSINNDPVYGEYNNGDYTNGIRGVAYGDDSLEYGDFSGTSEHNNGRIWAMNMWETRAALIAKYGFATGKDKHERLLVLGMKNTPDTPSFHDARTGYLVADSIQNPTATAGVGQNWCRIWNVFADNELGQTAAPDADTANAGSLTVSTDTPDECAPTAAIAPVADTAEGTTITFDGSGSVVGGDPGDVLTFAWDLDNDGTYDDATGVTAQRVYGDNGTNVVGLQVTNTSGYTATTTESFEVTNVAPTVTIDLSDLAGMKEGDTRTVEATFSDPGWLDTYTAAVSDGTPDLTDPTPTLAVTTPGGPGPDQGTVEADVTYGDDGTFTVTVTVTDDDTGAGSDADDASVANVAPTSVIDESGQQSYGGVSAFLVKAGQPVTIPASSEDPGSDDLRFTWDWDGALNGETATVTTSLVNPPGTDPDPSPTVQPRDVDLDAAHAYAKACLYTATVEVRDDDSGANTDSTAVVITGNATVSKGHGWWLNQYRPKGSTFTAATLQCYLDIVGHFSKVFNEKKAASTRAQAEKVLNAPAKAPADVIFDQHALGAWLNFANGSIRLDGPVDVDGDGIKESTFGAVMLAAENVRVNPASTSAQIKAQKDRIERIATQSAP